MCVASPSSSSNRSNDPSQNIGCFLLSNNIPYSQGISINPHSIISHCLQGKFINHVNVLVH